jgi:GNAT superfamily N-acetyltransferase
MIEVSSAPVEGAGDGDFVNTVCDVINRAYDVAEAGLWRSGKSRTTVEESAKAIADDEMVVAYLDGRLAGAVRTRLLDERTGWFGALAADPRFGGRGIGDALVAHVEHRSAAGGCVRVQLELLTPDPPHPHTDRLAGWYRRLGYREIDRKDLADVEPELASSLLLRQCGLAVCQKELATPPQSAR